MRTSAPGTPTPAERRRRGRGFTLIELVVVLFILTIVLGMVGVRLTRDHGDLVRDEARRLALVMQNAQQQAILEGRPLAFALTPEGYQFLRLDANSRLIPIRADELLAPRTLPPLMTIGPLKPRAEGGERMDLILFDPSGEFPAFTLVLALGDAVWYVQGQSDGQVHSSPSLETAAL